MITIKDVAREAGVSISTVSRVINNPQAVAIEKRQRIQDIIKAMGYAPNAAAREMVTGTTRQIGVLVSDIRNTYIASILTGFTKEIERHGYSVFLCITEMDQKKELHYVELMLQRRVEAVVLFGVRRIDAAHDARVAQRLGSTPILKVGSGFDEHYYNITTNEEMGAFLATEHLIELGHKKIGFINGLLEFDSYYCKQMGFQKAMSKHNMLVYADCLFTIPFENYTEAARGPIRKMLAMEQRPTAVLLAGDPSALSVYGAAAEAGLRIPQGLSVIGFGNSLAASMFPQLTTVDQMTDELGGKVVEMLMEILSGTVTEKKRVYDIELLYRASTASPGNE